MSILPGSTVSCEAWHGHERLSHVDRVVGVVAGDSSGMCLAGSDIPGFSPRSADEIMVW